MMTIFPVDEMIEQPLGWLRASLPKMEAATREIREGTSRAEIRRRRWLALTGLEAGDTHVTILVPVHNERRSLPSFLGALFASEFPSDADVQIVFIVNASRDGSASLIKRRLAWVAAPREAILENSLCDPRRENAAFEVCCGNLRFLVVETPAPGKANALNIGNEIAYRRGHAIAINVDANNWMEPDSIGQMIRRARENAVGAAESSAALVNSLEYCPTRISHANVPAKAKTQKAEVTGCMFGWSVGWVEKNGGFPQIAVEDYGVGLLALAQGKRIVESEAAIWVFSPGNAADENRQALRFLRGALQLKRQFGNDPAALEILREDFPLLRPWAGRLKYHLARKRKERLFLWWLRGAWRWLYSERLIFRARQELRRDPYGQTWEPISSTK